MKRFLFVAIVFFAWSASAQGSRYQWDLSVGYGLGIGEYAPNRIHIETVHGVRIEPYVFAGAGIALSGFEDRRNMMLVFADIKGYLLKETKVVPYFFADLGYGFGHERGCYGAAGLGIEADTPRIRFFVDLGYQSQGLICGPPNMDAFLLRIGFRI